MKERFDCVINYGGSCNNLDSMEMVEKLSLTTRCHLQPYYIQWFNNSGKVKERCAVCVHFSISTYADYVDCDVVPMQHVPYYLVDHGNLIKILYTMVVIIIILLFIRIAILLCFL